MKIKLNDNETQAVFAMITFTLPLISGILDSIKEDKPFIFSEHVKNVYGKSDLKEVALALCLLVKGVEPIVHSKKFKEHFMSALDEIERREMVVMH